jgi:hypothetical protein
MAIVTYGTRTDDKWWVGFDCTHGFDVLPALEARMRSAQEAVVATFPDHPEWRGAFEPAPPVPWESYKTVDWVRSEVESLARQAIDAWKEESR